MTLVDIEISTTSAGGSPSARNSVEIDYASWLINYVDAAIGPVSKVWDGAQWVVGIPKVWDGAQWVPSVARPWDGAQWL